MTLQSIICNANSSGVVTTVCTTVTLEEWITRAIITTAIRIQDTRSRLAVQILVSQEANLYWHYPSNVCSVNPKYFQILAQAKFSGARLVWLWKWGGS